MMKYNSLFIKSLIQKIEGICQAVQIDVDSFVDADFDDSDIERLEKCCDELDRMRDELMMRAEDKAIRMHG